MPKYNEELFYYYKGPQTLYEIGVPASKSLQARAGGPAELIALTQININEMLRCLDPLNCKPIFGPLVSALNT